MGDPGTTSVLYAARPSFSVDGQAEADLSQGLLSMMVEETADGLYRCEATFSNWGPTPAGQGYLYLDRRLLDFGRAISVEAGDQDSRARIFDGVITGLSASHLQDQPPQVTVLAEDRLQDLRMTRRTRTFEDVSDEDVFRQIASEHSLAPEISVDGPTHRALAQVNQSDLAFVRERARAVDAELWVEGRSLHVQSRADRNAGELTLTCGRSLRELSVLADVATQRTSLTVSGWDVAAKEAIVHRADESAIRGELNGDQSGPAILQAALGERAECVVHAGPVSLAEARGLAEAGFRRMARRFVTGCGVAEGDGRIRVGARVRIEQIGTIFEGPYYVIEARHQFDATAGFTTRFCVERPGMAEV